MTSFIQTMFVQPTSPCRAHQFPLPASPLKPLHSNILAASESCVHLQWPSTPQSAYQSPIHQHFRSVLGQAPAAVAAAATAAGKDLFSDSTKPYSQPLRPPTSKSNAKARSKNQQQQQTSQDDVFGGLHTGFGLGLGLADIGQQADLLTFCSNSNARNRTSFKPQRAQKGTNSWQLKQFAEATLGSGSLRKVVQLPEGEDRDEWLAVNVVDFYNQINLLYGAITEFCSPQTCPEMKATDEFEYLWHHPPAFPKPTRLPAPTYISHLLTWTSTLLSDTALFPTQPGVSFPSNFESTVRQIFKRLYRIYAHIYCHHYPVVRGLGLEAHLNTGFKHYVLFVDEFGLADDGKGGKGARMEWFGPLGDLVESMLRSD